MNLTTFHNHVAEHSDHGLVFRFPSGETLPLHFHITEVGKVTKDFVDCGGARRTSHTCRLQTLVANDVDHRLLTDKLSGILAKTIEVLSLDGDLTVDVEIQRETIAVYEIASCAVANNTLTFTLQPTKTACLAPEACKLDTTPNTLQILPINGGSGICDDTSTDCC